MKQKINVVLQNKIDIWSTYFFFKYNLTIFTLFLALIENGYHGSNPYHNSVHAADVTQAMHCYLQEVQVRGQRSTIK